MDTGLMTGSPQNVWYARGFATNAPETGLPPAGALLTSQSQPDHQYRFQEYQSNNAVLIRASSTNATLTLTTPGNYAALSFLAGAAGGSATVKCLVHHLDQSAESGTFLIADWFDGAKPVLVADGRFDLVTRTFNSVSSGNPRLYAYDLALTNTSSPVERVLFQYQRRPGQIVAPNVAIFAVSGATHAEFRPIELSGFDQDLVIEQGYRGFELPNLTGQVQKVTPAALLAGDGGNASFRISNSGATPSPLSAMAFYLARDRQSFAESEKLGQVEIPPVPSGQSTNLEFAFQVPASAPIGSYALNWWIDPRGEVDEYRSDDNRGSFQMNLGPNLEISPRDIALVTNVLDRQVTFTFAVQNSGTPAPATKATIYFGSAWGPSPEAREVGQLEVPASVSGDPPLIARFTLAVPSDLPRGFYAASAWVDSVGRVEEWAEGDNQGGMWIEIPDPPSLVRLSAALNTGSRLQISGAPSDRAVTLQVSSDLQHWMDVQSFTVGESLFHQQDCSGAGAFFRVTVAGP
jgi:hypothetical protein